MNFKSPIQRKLLDITQVSDIQTATLTRTFEDDNFPYAEVCINV